MRPQGASRRDAGVVEVTYDKQPRRYAAREINLIVTTTAGNREYTITPALIDAVGLARAEPAATTGPSKSPIQSR